ncbi:MAG TPA: hypothetical protein VFH27_02450 [Longimicrobiaceae bacterium]|nr:hypothetical protein [Longimicrobiaceae bacterium]
MESREVTQSALVLNPALQSWPFDGAASEPMTMCEVPRADGSLARFVLPARVVAVLQLFDGRPTEQVVAASPALAGVPQKEVARLLNEVFVPRGLLVPPGAEAHAPGRRGDRLGYLTFRMKVLPPRVVVPIARALGWLFARPVMAVLIAAVVAAHLWFYLRLVHGSGMGLGGVKGSHAAAVLGVMIVSTLIHEFGHAAAAAKHGCRRLEIGWGMYYYMTILYTDLSEAWRLPRAQRALLDVGGIYFQAVFGLVLLAAYELTGSVIPLYCFLATDLAIAGSLNPFFRMDGYWLLSDALGVTQLHAAGTEVLRRGALRLFGRRSSAPLPLSVPAIVIVGLYSGSGIAFFGTAFSFAIRRLVIGIAVGYPEMLRALWATFALPFHPLAFGAALVEVLWRTLVLVGTLKFTWMFVSRLLGWLASLGRLLRRAWREARRGAEAPLQQAA